MRTKLIPLILTTFLVAPASMLAPIRIFAILVSAIVATVLLPIAMLATPVPTSTLFFPATLSDAVHLPVHLIAPAP